MRKGVIHQHPKSTTFICVNVVSFKANAIGMNGDFTAGFFGRFVFSSFYQKVILYPLLLVNKECTLDNIVEWLLLKI